MAEDANPDGITARYLMHDLPEGFTKDDLQGYFEKLGLIEEVSVRELTKGGVAGSIKFASPTMELRRTMLNEKHVIKGVRVKVETWKMHKQNRGVGRPEPWGMEGGKDPWGCGGKGKAGKDWDPYGYSKGPPDGYGKGKAGKDSWDPYGYGKGPGWDPYSCGKGAPDGYGKGAPDGYGKGKAGMDAWDPYGYGKGPPDGYGKGPPDGYGKGPPDGYGKGPPDGYGKGALDGYGKGKDWDPYGCGKGKASQDWDPYGYGKGPGWDPYGPYGGGKGAPDGYGKGAPDGYGKGKAGKDWDPYGYGKGPPDGYGKGPPDGYGKGGKDPWGYGGGWGYDGYDGYSAGAYGSYGPAYDYKGDPGKGGPCWSAKGEPTWGKGAYGGGGGKGSSGGSKGDAGGKDGDGKNKDITARFLLADLSELITEESIRAYFAVFGEIEEVTLRKIESNGKVMGSVKFATPTPELRDQMLKEKHEIEGFQVTVQTWKMQKQHKPGYAAKKEQENAAYHAAKYAKGKGLSKGKTPY